MNTVLAWACAGLLLLCAGLGIDRNRLADKVDTLEAAAKVDKATITSQTESLAAAAKANAEWKEVAETRAQRLTELQAETVRLREEGEAAVEAARQEAASIGRAFDRFVAQFRQRPEQCSAALSAADTACASLEFY
jgi:glutathione S-transferase